MSADEKHGQSAYDAVFDGQFDYVCHTLRRLGVHEADLEDVAQTVFLSVYRRFDEFDPSRAVRPWLVAFAFRAASNYRRAEHRRAEDLGEVVQASTDGQLAAERADQTRRIQEVLDQMTMERKVILLMFDVDGHTAPDIAAALEIPLNTVYSRIRLARQDFRSIGAHLLSAEGSADE